MMVLIVDFTVRKLSKYDFIDLQIQIQILLHYLIQVLVFKYLMNLINRFRFDQIYESKPYAYNGLIKKIEV